MARSVYLRRPRMLVERTTRFTRVPLECDHRRNRRAVGLMADIVHNRIASGPLETILLNGRLSLARLTLRITKKAKTTALPGFCSGVTYSKSA